MRLYDLAQSFNVEVSGADVEISGVALDSRAMSPGYLYLAVCGQVADGHDFIADAIQAGAVAVVAENSDRLTGFNVSGWCDPNLKQNVSRLASLCFDGPSRFLSIAGVTGTNGKTSITSYLMQAMQKLGHHCGQVGTLGLQIDQKLTSTANTTPDACTLQNYFKQAVDESLDFVAMEVSSHALEQGRVDDIAFNTAVFANLTHDHLDYHETMEAYFAAKCALFKVTTLESVAINIDDEYGQALTRLLSAQEYQMISYSLENDWADVYAYDLEQNNLGIKFKVQYRSSVADIQTQLIGRFNVSNLLAVASVLLANKVSWDDTVECLSRIKPVKGRMEVVNNSLDILALVDYAHTPDALKNVLLSCRECIASQCVKYPDSKLITVFGCGGDRDKAKRPLMAQVAEMLSDICVVTTDNPRFELQNDIVEQVISGFSAKDFIRIDDRAQAIKFAVEQAKEGDIILIAGKGHEDYQLLGSERLHFSDVECLSSLLNGGVLND
jgi:UDP-N-acetylmuramyl-tripeptide synthetase